MRDLLRKRYFKQYRSKNGATHFSQFVREVEPIFLSDPEAIKSILGSVNQYWDINQRLEFYLEKAAQYLKSKGLNPENDFVYGGSYTLDEYGNIYYGNFTEFKTVGDFRLSLGLSRSGTIFPALLYALEKSAKYQNELDLWYAAKMLCEIHEFKQSNKVDENYCRMLNIGNYFLNLVLILAEPQLIRGRVNSGLSNEKQLEILEWHNIVDDFIQNNKDKIGVWSESEFAHQISNRNPHIARSKRTIRGYVNEAIKKLAE